MTPEALRRRMAHGNIYTAGEGRRRARELLPGRQPRRAAGAGAAVGRRPGRRGAPGTARPHGITGHVGDAGTGRRRDHRRARRRPPHPAGRPHGARTRGDLLGVHVRPADGLARPSTERLARERGTAQRARRRVPRGQRPATWPMASCSSRRTENATQIVLGASQRSRWTELLRGSVINAVIRASVAIDVHVISTADRRPGRPGRPAVARGHVSPRRRQIGWALAVLVPPLLTLAFDLRSGRLRLPSVLLSSCARRGRRRRRRLVRRSSPRSAASCSPTGSSRLRHTFTIAEGENPRPCACSWSWAAS